MKSKIYAQILDSAVEEKIPESVNIAPRILARIQSEKAEQAFWNKRKPIDFSSTTGNPMKPRMRFATILLVIAALLALTGAAYAVYRWMGDPGLQAVQDAGLTTELNVTAQPTVLPTSTPPRTPQPATSNGTSQTIEGVTLTLDWVYLDESGLALGMNFSDLPADLTLDAPKVTFAGIDPAQAQGYSQNILAEENRTVYVSYQVIQADAVGGKVNLGVDVPLLRQAGEEQTALGQFHFDLADVPVVSGQTMPIQQTYSAKRSGVQVRMRSARVMPSGTEVVACYDFPTQDAAWEIQEATVQLGDGPETAYQTIQPLGDIQDDHCVRLRFAEGSAGKETKLMIFRVRKLAAPSQPEMTGPWEFYVDLPVDEIIPGKAGPKPTAIPRAIDDQTIEGVNMTLDWVFADAKRVSFGYTITGLEQDPNAIYLSGMIVVKDAQGNPIGDGYGGSSTAEWVEGQPGVLKGTWDKVLQEALLEPDATFSIDVTLDGTGGADYANVAAFLPRSQEGPLFEPGVEPPIVPDRLVGTFHFDVTTPVYPATVLEPNQILEANGIAMQLKWAQLTPSYTNLILCYPKPSAKDWMIGYGTTLDAGAYDAPLSGYALLGDTDYGGYTSSLPDSVQLPPLAAGERCVWIDFLLGHSNTEKTLTLTIPIIEQSMPEVIPDDEIRMAHEKLRAQGIEMDYTSSSSAGGGGGSGPIFNKTPEGMEWEEVHRRFLEALGYIHTGPWTFEIEIPQ